MAKLGLRLNFQGKAPTQYVGYEFSSMGMLGGTPIAIDENGIYEVFTGDTDNGSKIDAHFDLPETNLQTSLNKRLRSLFLGCHADGNLFVSISDDEENEATYQVRPMKIGKQHTTKVNCGRNWHKGCYYSIRIGNVDGAYFDIDYFQILSIMLARKPGKF